MGIDRGRRRDLSLVCVGTGVTWFGNALGLALSLSNLPLVFAFVALLSTGNAIARPAASALVPALVGEDNATRGYSWISSSSSTGMLLGTAAGGVLVADIGAHHALLIDALTYAIQAGTLLLVRVDRRPQRHPGRPNAGRQILAGLKFLASDRVLIVAIGATAALNFAGTMVNVAEVFFITDTLHGSAVTLGIMQAVWMAGLLVGARLAARVSTLRGIAVLLACGGCLPGAGFALPAVFPMVVLFAISYLIGGIGNGIQNVCQSGLIRSRTPEEMRGRAFSGSGTVVNVTGTVGNVLSGLLVTVIGARGCFGFAAALCLATGLIALLANLRLTAPETLPKQRTARTV